MWTASSPPTANRIPRNSLASSSLQGQLDGLFVHLAPVMPTLECGSTGKALFPGLACKGGVWPRTSRPGLVPEDLRLRWDPPPVRPVGLDRFAQPRRAPESRISCRTPSGSTTPTSETDSAREERPSKGSRKQFHSVNNVVYLPRRRRTRIDSHNIGPFFRK